MVISHGYILHGAIDKMCTLLSADKKMHQHKQNKQYIAYPRDSHRERYAELIIISCLNYSAFPSLAVKPCISPCRDIAVSHSYLPIVCSSATARTAPSARGSP